MMEENNDEFYMSLAQIEAMNSNDPNTKVGAVIVKDDKILSKGFNSEPDGFNEGFPWERDGEYLKTKYPFVCHGELNAICNYSGLKEDLKGAKIYVTLFPCNECAKLIIQSGIKEVIYESDKYADSKSTIASKMMLNKCKIKYRQFTFEKEEKPKVKTK